MLKIKAKRNIWGNYKCYIGTKVIVDFGQEFDACYWLMQKLNTGKYELSGKSDITLYQVSDLNQRLINQD